MARIYLFDWGDTLMVDIPGQSGKMCDWPEVKPVDGAAETLAHLSQSSKIYVATNAAESAPNDIERAFERAGLSSHISGYFCRANLGIAKGTPAFYQAILRQLGAGASAVTMVGDSYENDIAPALEAGLSAVWLRPGNDHRECQANLRVIANLRELCVAG
jgi:putative hydrolase of the HAD superfamily